MKAWHLVVIWAQRVVLTPVLTVPLAHLVLDLA